MSYGSCQVLYSFTEDGHFLCCPNTAHLIQDGKTKEVKISEIKRGDLVLVKPGEEMPADGIVMNGSSYLDESMLTGESKPIQKKKRR